jgi:hypothetical protein
MHHRALVVFAVLALVMLAGGPVDAKTLRTLAARVDSDQSVRVLVTNLDTKPMEDLAVTLTNFSGTVTMPNANLCAEDAPLPPQNTCQVDYSSGQGGFATVTGKGKFSASLHVLGPDDGDSVIILPATK